MSSLGTQGRQGLCAPLSRRKTQRADPRIYLLGCFDEGDVGLTASSFVDPESILRVDHGCPPTPAQATAAFAAVETYVTQVFNAVCALTSRKAALAEKRSHNEGSDGCCCCCCFCRRRRHRTSSRQGGGGAGVANCCKAPGCRNRSKRLGTRRQR